jgi:hypothetical protein
LGPERQAGEELKRESGAVIGTFFEKKENTTAELDIIFKSKTNIKGFFESF